MIAFGIAVDVLDGARSRARKNWAPNACGQA
jgi:hypothetical protein